MGDAAGYQILPKTKVTANTTKYIFIVYIYFSVTIIILVPNMKFIDYLSLFSGFLPSCSSFFTLQLLFLFMLQLLFLSFHLFLSSFLLFLFIFFSITW